ncbi:clostripain-related cysteine peptidase [Alkalibaculum sporogenes]|uniref:clostripain-related cysteine peptidase n=1 Tax=Alkalibaculum sporogenes TaxID=2655001 RepID=UPI00187B7DCE|nr:clostripain-related cysteine peptidase [Alkalibaculum sporogenes]
MKKVIVFMLLLFTIVCLSCTNQGDRLKNNELKEYTFLIYMNGSDLETEHGAGTSDLYEMMKAGTTDNINVVIETGGTKNWQNHYIDASQNQRWLVKKNNLEKLQDLGTKNMGVSSTLKDFLVWGVSNYPAQKHVLILWNHGGGSISGFGYDERHFYDTLLLVELEQALTDAMATTGVKLEMIGFDACLMATIETADVVAPFANYLVASTELEPAIGWEYSAFLKKASEEKLDGEMLGKEIADSFYKDTKKYGLNDTVTLSVIDTSRIGILKKSFENFIMKADEDIYDASVFNQISNTVSRAEYYGGQSPSEGYSNMIDLGDLASKLSDDYAQDKNDIVNNVNDAVVYQIKGKARGKSTGISVYFPYYNKENIEYELPVYGTIDFSEPYNDFLTRYTEVARNDTSEIEFASENINKEGNSYKANVKSSEMENVSQVRTVLGKKIDENKILLYGGSPSANYNKGEINTEFDNKWLSINGNMVYSYVTRVEDDYITYSLPAVLNDEYVNIKVAWYADDGEDGYYKILGAWHGVIPESKIVRKEIIEVKQGDVIKPIFKEYNIDKKEAKSIEGKAFILLDDPEIIIKELDEEDLVLGFCIDDYSLNQCYSNFIPIEE